MKRCPKCGNTEPSSSKFCSVCSCQLEEIARQNPFRDPEEVAVDSQDGVESQPAPAKKKKNPLLIAVPVVAAVVVAGVVIGVAVSGQLSKQSGASQETAVPTETTEVEESATPTVDLNEIFETETPEPTETVTPTPETTEEPAVIVTEVPQESAAASESPATSEQPTESKPAESQTTESKPAESQTTESKPAESQTTESKPAESQTTESKPAESQTTESKPAESQTTEAWTPVGRTYQGVTFTNDYVFADSNSRYLDESELTSLSVQQLDIARNEIFARLGRMFKTADLQTYFNSCSWYTPLYSADTFADYVTLNDYEKQNATLILEYEQKMGYR